MWNENIKDTTGNNSYLHLDFIASKMISLWPSIGCLNTDNISYETGIEYFQLKMTKSKQGDHDFFYENDFQNWFRVFVQDLNKVLLILTTSGKLWYKLATSAAEKHNFYKKIYVKEYT